MKFSTLPIVAGLLIAAAPASQAQFGTSYTVGWVGCPYTVSPIPMPGGFLYYAQPSTFSYGMYNPCTSSILPPTNSTHTNPPPPPPPPLGSTGNSQETPPTDGFVQQRDTPGNPNLVTDDGPPGAGPPGGNSDAIRPAGFDAAVTATPEPASLILVASGLAGLAAIARRRRKS